MEEVIARLNEAILLRNTMAKQEAALWQKIGETLVTYLEHQRRQETSPARPKPSSPAIPVCASGYVNNKQAAEYLGMSAGTLNKWRVYGQGPQYVKIGSSIRYRVSDLDDYLAGNFFPHTSAYPTK